MSRQVRRREVLHTPQLELEGSLKNVVGARPEREIEDDMDVTEVVSQEMENGLDDIVEIAEDEDNYVGDADVAELAASGALDHLQEREESEQQIKANHEIIRVRSGSNRTAAPDNVEVPNDRAAVEAAEEPAVVVRTSFCARLCEAISRFCSR